MLRDSCQAQWTQHRNTAALTELPTCNGLIPVSLNGSTHKIALSELWSALAMNSLGTKEY